MKNQTTAKITASSKELKNTNKLRLVRPAILKDRQVKEQNLWPCLSIH